MKYIIVCKSNRIWDAEFVLFRILHYCKVFDWHILTIFNVVSRNFIIIHYIGLWIFGTSEPNDINHISTENIYRDISYHLIGTLLWLLSCSTLIVEIRESINQPILVADQDWTIEFQSLDDDRVPIFDFKFIHGTNLKLVNYFHLFNYFLFDKEHS